MPGQNSAPALPEIRAAVLARLQELRPLVEEMRRLEAAEKALGELPAAPAAPAVKGASRVAGKKGSQAGPLATALLSKEEPEPQTAPVEEAPLGYTKDGRPRKRRPAKNPDYAKQGWETKRAKVAAKEATEQSNLDVARAAVQGPQSTSLHVISSTHPTERELRDRRVAHTTQAPAMRGATG